MWSRFQKNLFNLNELECIQIFQNKLYSYAVAVGDELRVSFSFNAGFSTQCHEK